jgi:hypothetical protein
LRVEILTTEERKKSEELSPGPTPTLEAERERRTST